jgi:CRISPR-associated protein Csh2
MKNKEFLFIYDAALCNPNGDPDQENKPRMDRATKTNLVTDTRLKRYIRDYLIDNGNEVFVSMMNGNKVSNETRLTSFMNEITVSKDGFEELINRHPEVKNEFEKAKFELENPKKETKTDKLKFDNYFDLFLKTPKEKYKSLLGKLNNVLLLAIIKEKLIDIRFFGGAFAVGNFSKTITGPIQINFGYSMHPVELNDSNSIVTIMGDKEGQSGIGKKETLHYSLIAFTGTINSKKAEIVNLSGEDLDLFRSSIVLSLLSQRSDSKKNQYPRIYLEIEYKENEIYGRLGDLRNLIIVKSKVTNFKGDPDFSKVRTLNDLEIDCTPLNKGIMDIQDKIEKIKIWTSMDNTFSKFTSSLPENLKIEFLNI